MSSREAGAMSMDAAENSDMREAMLLQHRHEISLGRLCMAWAALDRSIDDLFQPLLQCAPAQVACVVTNLDQVSSRCDVLKRLLVEAAPSDAYRTWLIALLDRVSGELAPVRNRYIHDAWSVSNLEIVRMDKRAKISRPQSRQPLILKFDTRHVTAPDEVDRLTGKASLLLAMLSFAAYDLRVWRRTGQPLEPHPEYIEASKPNARWLSPQEHDEALRQGLRPSEYVYD